MLRLPKFEHMEVKTMDELFSALEEYGERIKVIAGGTDLIPRMKHRVIHPKYVLNLKGVSRELNFIRLNNNKELRIGALITLAELEMSPLIKKWFPTLLQAIRSIGTNQIRNMGTIGGNICLETRCYYYNQSHQFQFIGPCYKRGGNLCYLTKKGKECLAVYMADTAPALIGMKAKVIVKNKISEKIIPLEDIYGGKSDSPLRINNNEIITEIIIPCEKGLRGLYLKQTFRGSTEFGIASLALCIKLTSDKEIKDIRLVLGSVSSRPVRMNTIEQLLKNEKITPSLIEKASGVLPKEVTFFPHHGNSANYVRNVSIHLLKSGLKSMAK